MEKQNKAFAYRVPIGDYNYLQCTYALTFFVYIISVLASVICTATAFHEEERKKKRERNPIYNRFFNKVVVIVFLFTGL